MGAACGQTAVVEEGVPTVTVRLWRADAVVLYDWLATTDLKAVPISLSAQKQALADLLSRFEWAADSYVTESTPEEAAAARADGMLAHAFIAVECAELGKGHEADETTGEQ